MRRRSARSRRGLLAVAALVAIALVPLALSLGHYREPASAPPTALNHIAEKNHKAAVVAAAHQRAEAAATTAATNNILEAQRRGEAQAEVAIRRFPNNEMAR